MWSLLRVIGRVFVNGLILPVLISEHVSKCKKLHLRLLLTRADLTVPC